MQGIVSDSQSHANARLPDDLRHLVRLDPMLGAGNYLQVAYRVNPRRDVPLVFSDRPVRTFWGESYDQFSIATLKQVTDNYAAWYLRAGVQPHDPVAVYLSEGAEYLIHYTALTSIGAIPILINGAMDPAIAAAHIQRTGGVGIFTDPVHYQQLAPHVQKNSALQFVVTDDMLAGTAPEVLQDQSAYQHDADDPIMITHTSGTTGVPKAVLLQHSKFFYGIRHLLSLPTVRGTERILTSLPSSHNSAIAYAMHAILSGFELMIVSSRSGEYVLRMIERFAPGTVISFPHTYVEMSECDMGRYRLDSVSLWLSSGDASHEPHIRALIQHGHHFRGEMRINGSQFVDGLGSSEMGHTLFRVVHTPQTRTYRRCIGFPQKWVEAVVLDEQGELAPPNQVGRLGVRGPSITSGYWNDSVRTYRSRVGGYWLTGDLVYQDEMGCFYHVDRITDAIRTRQGMLYSLQTEELFLSSCPQVADCTVVGVQAGDGYQEPFCLVRLKPGQTLSAAELKTRFNELLHQQQRPLLYGVLLAQGQHIPVGVTGKVLKQSLRELYPTLAVLKQSLLEKHDDA